MSTITTSSSTSGPVIPLYKNYNPAPIANTYTPTDYNNWYRIEEEYNLANVSMKTLLKTPPEITYKLEITQDKTVRNRIKRDTRFLTLQPVTQVDGVDRVNPKVEIIREEGENPVLILTQPVGSHWSWYAAKAELEKIDVEYKKPRITLRNGNEIIIKNAKVLDVTRVNRYKLELIIEEEDDEPDENTE